MDVPHRVPAALEPYVLTAQGYQYRLPHEAVHLGAPGASATVIISFDEPLDVAWLDDASSRQRHWLLASGLHTGPVLIRTHGVQHGIQLELTPLGCRVLLGAPIGALRHALVAHNELRMGIPDHLHARLADASWPDRFRLLDDYLLRTVTHSREALPDDLAHAWQLIASTQGRIVVSDLAVETGWSRRHLVNRFAIEFGLPPRDLIRLYRFGSALRFARTGASWTEVAAQAGYADQAHLSREFRAFAGRTPTAWREELFHTPADIA